MKRGGEACAKAHKLETDYQQHTVCEILVCAVIEEKHSKKYVADQLKEWKGDFTVNDFEKEYHKHMGDTVPGVDIPKVTINGMECRMPMSISFKIIELPGKRKAWAWLRDHSGGYTPIHNLTQRCLVLACSEAFTYWMLIAIKEEPFCISGNLSNCCLDYAMDWHKAEVKGR